MDRHSNTALPWSTRALLTLGFTALIFLVLVLGLWSVRTEIAGAVIANGTVVVESNRQVVQHSEGGIVNSIEAKDGDRVRAGQVLLRLDDTLLQSELAVLQSQLIELGARRARLVAERDWQPKVIFPTPLNNMAAGIPSAQEQLNGQLVLFHARRESLSNELEQIQESVAQTRHRILGVEAQLDAYAIQKDLISSELSDQESLLQRGLVPTQRVTLLKREAARLDGDIGKLQADIAQLRGQIASFELEKLRLRAARREGAIVTLRDVQYHELELSEQRRGVAECISRTKIVAPMDGIIYGTSIFAIRSVVRPAAPLMYVIPQGQALVLSIRVSPNYIDQVFVGQSASLKFRSFNQRTTPEIQGRVVDVSADVLHDEDTQEAYFQVSVLPADFEISTIRSLKIVPGMPVEAYLLTGSRTPLSYLTRPLTDYFSRAMRES